MDLSRYQMFTEMAKDLWPELGERNVRRLYKWLSKTPARQGVFNLITIFHDDWCDAVHPDALNELRTGKCNCNPEFGVSHDEDAITLILREQRRRDAVAAATSN